MTKAKQSGNRVSVKPLLDLIPDEELSKLASQAKVDRCTKILYVKSMSYLLLYGLPAGRVLQSRPMSWGSLILQTCVAPALLPA